MPDIVASSENGDGVGSNIRILNDRQTDIGRFVATTKDYDQHLRSIWAGNHGRNVILREANSQEGCLSS
jgi:hypothetical protein